METPGHTQDHVSYIMTHVTPESTKTPFLFCGDTLFISGCGRLLNGTAEQLFYSLQKLMSLPNETLVFCGHEYSLNNLRFAKYIEPDN
jgi:hydroxyacylglutathione hydrolase